MRAATVTDGGSAWEAGECTYLRCITGYGRDFCASFGDQANSCVGFWTLLPATLSTLGWKSTLAVRGQTGCSLFIFNLPVFTAVLMMACPRAGATPPICTGWRRSRRGQCRTRARRARRCSRARTPSWSSSMRRRSSATCLRRCCSMASSRVLRERRARVKGVSYTQCGHMLWTCGSMGGQLGAV